MYMLVLIKDQEVHNKVLVNRRYERIQKMSKYLKPMLRVWWSVCRTWMQVRVFRNRYKPELS
jgi:hypothetical protein